MYLVPTGVDQKTYDTFQDCWDQQLSGGTSREFAAKFEPYLQVMQLMEKKNDCSGACVPALFWFTKSLETIP